MRLSRVAVLGAVLGVLACAPGARALARSGLRAGAHDDSLDPVAAEKELNSNISRDEFEECDEITSCDACVGKRGCGWCADSAKCMGGAPAGPVDLSGDRIEPDYDKCQLWAYSQCRASSCEAKAECNTCVVDAFCGWCGNTQSCMEGNSKGPVSGYCQMGWVRVPPPSDTLSEQLVQSATPSLAVHRQIQQLCLANDILTGQTIQANIQEEKRRNATEAQRIETCDPCEGEWPRCDCGGNEQVEPPRPMSEDYVVRQADEAVGVRPGSVNITYLNELKERKKMAMTFDMRAAEAKGKFQDKEKRLNRLLNLLPPSPTDKSVEDVQKKDEAIVKSDALMNAVQNVSSPQMAKLVDGVMENMGADSNRVVDDVMSRIAAVSEAVGGGCPSCDATAATGATGATGAPATAGSPAAPTEEGPREEGNEHKEEGGEGAQGNATAAGHVHVGNLTVEDPEGMTTARAQLEQTARKAKMEFAIEQTENQKEDMEKKVEEEKKEVEAEEEEVANEPQVSEEEAEKLAEEENQLVEDEKKEMDAEVASEVSKLQAVRNDAETAAEGLVAAKNALIAKEIEAKKKAESSAEMGASAAARISSLREEETSLTKVNASSVVEIVKKKVAPKSQYESTKSCMERVLGVVTTSRESAVNSIEGLLKALQGKLASSDKEEAVRHHIGELLRAQGEAEADVDASAPDLAVAIEGCIITESQ